MANRNISIPLGITIGLVASFVQSLGLTIQRKSHVLDQLLPQDEQRVEHRRPLWLLGFAIFISSNVLGSLIQIASLPVVILAPLGAVSLLWNAFFARFLLGDVFSPWMILGTLLIAGGAVLIAVFGIVPEPTRSLEDLLELFSRPTFVIYFSLLGIAVFMCLVITHVAEYSLTRRLAMLSASPPTGTDPSTLVTGVTTTISATLTTERTPLLDRKSPVRSLSSSFLSPKHPTPHLPATTHRRLLIAISYASFSGVISGMCLLFAKSGVELLLLTFRGQNQFWKWQAWMLVIGLVVFAVMQLWYLHKALILANPTLVCPSAFCFYNLSSILNGLVYFDQFALIPPVHLLLVTLGIVVLLAGVWVVSIQTGGGGVDMGTWDGSETESEGIESGTRYLEGDIADSGNEEDVISEESGGTARQTRSEFLGMPNTTRRVTSSLSTEEEFPSPSSSQHPSMTSTRHRARHRRGTIDLYTYPTQSLTQLSPIGTGFQIGLSPVSPGFVLVPTERRRRIGSILGRSEPRRTVSEGVER